jgi:predicted transglutaminase-like cysteine proteinase
MARRLIEEDRAACVSYSSTSPPAPLLSPENKEQSLADIMAAVAASARAEEMAELKEIEKKASTKVTNDNNAHDINDDNKYNYNKLFSDCFSCIFYSHF